MLALLQRPTRPMPRHNLMHTNKTHTCDCIVRKGGRGMYPAQRTCLTCLYTAAAPDCSSSSSANRYASKPPTCTHSSTRHQRHSKVIYADPLAPAVEWHASPSTTPHQALAPLTHIAAEPSLLSKDSNTGRATAWAVASISPLPLPSCQQRRVLSHPQRSAQHQAWGMT